MIEGLHWFLTELRRLGIAASPAEWLEALRAVELVGVHERAAFREALRCTLVKQAGQFEVFERAFERCFATPAGFSAGRRRRRRGAAAGAREEPRKRQWAQTARGREGEGRPPAARGSATDLRRRLVELRGGAPRRRGRLRHVVLDPAGRHDPRPGRGHAPAERRDLGRSMQLIEEREIAAEVPRLVRRIRLCSGRRRRRAPVGLLHLRRMFRRNAAHGGVPFVLPRQRRRPRRTRVVLLIDVSWSVARAAGLFLGLAAEFLRRARDVRVVCFVDRPIDATSTIGDWLARAPLAAEARPRHGTSRGGPGGGILRRGVSFAALLEALPGFDPAAPSDYGRTLHSLARSRLRPGGRDTVLVVLGDGRTNRFAPQAWALEEISARCGAVLWLVPEERARWGTGDSALPAYAEHVDTLVEARDLVGLARGVGELLRRL